LREKRGRHPEKRFPTSIQNKETKGKVDNT
jgi:hypothetical protein